MVDTHCHISLEYFDDIDSVIERAIKVGVSAIIVNGCDTKSNMEVLDLVKKYDIVYGALGIQPEEIDDYSEDSINFIIDHINDNKIVAVGEIGLDYHYDCDRNKQIEVFKKQLDIASKYHKPVIVHSRDCIQETYDILKMYDVKGILHCYSGSVEMAKEFNKLGFLLGIGGICTFKNAKKLIEVIREVSMEYIVLETDAPYLAPEPYRGKQNEPSYLYLISNKIADIKGISKKDVIKITTLNARGLFDI
jgi:TatD DNase family protein